MQKTHQMNSEMNSFLQKTSENMNKTLRDNQEKMRSTHGSMQFSTKDDRLIDSISMIKDILLSNMQLREEQLNLAEQHDKTIQESF